ncbi:MAG: putative DNA binding domain-containing protein, partial [Akkermansia sp.]
MNKHAQLLGDLLTKARERGSLGGELPYLEFKRNIGDSQSRHGFSISYEKLGEYISGLANAACLHDQSYAYLILGVEDASWKIVGTNFYPATDSYRNQNFQRWLFSKFKAQCAFDIFEVDAEGKHVVIFQIPAASGLPVSYQDKRWIRIASSLCDLADYPDLERRIYQSNSDWSAHIIPEAQLSDLDEVAIAKGRALYAEKNPHLREALESWDDATFLNKAKVTTQGKITRTALLLFGKEESCTLLSPYVGELRWI